MRRFLFPDFKLSLSKANKKMNLVPSPQLDKQIISPPNS